MTTATQIKAEIARLKKIVTKSYPPKYVHAAKIKKLEAQLKMLK